MARKQTFTTQQWDEISGEWFEQELVVEADSPTSPAIPDLLGRWSDPDSTWPVSFSQPVVQNGEVCWFITFTSDHGHLATMTAIHIGTREE